MDESKKYYLDALPEKINAREDYTYKVRLGVNPDTSLVDVEGGPARSQATIRIELPYDGFTHLSTSSAENLRRQLDGLSGLDVYGQIGHLVISRPPDWEHDWVRQPGLEKFPIRVPLINEQVTDARMWTADVFRAVIQHEYHPEAPRFLPLQMNVDVFDNAQDSAESNWNVASLLDGRLQQAASIPAIIDLLDGDPQQGGQMVIALSIVAYLPDFLAPDTVRVQVEDLKLNWPTIAPGWEISVVNRLDDKNVAFRYNPDEQCVELPVLESRREQAEPGSLLVPFRCSLGLTLHYPGQLFRLDELKGSLRIALQGSLLSGSLLGWMDVYGRRLPEKSGVFQLQTNLNVQFNAILGERFRQRRRAVFRQWTLPGVRLSSLRLDDIAAALRDMGYQLAEQPRLESIQASAVDGQPASSVLIGLVQARRRAVASNQDPHELYLQVWALPVSPAATLRKRDLLAGGEVNTTWDTSDLVLLVRGLINGPGSQLALNMDNLMEQVKNRFAAVADER